MRTLTVVLLVVCAVLVSPVSAFAQEKPGNVAEVVTVMAKGGAYQQLEQALKGHYQWHKSQKDNFAWFVWEVANGDHAGSFVIGTFGHHWKDLDARASFEKADEADFIANVVPTASAVVPAFYATIPEASRPTGAMEPPAMSQLTHYYVKLAGVPEFNDALKEIKSALDKANYPVHSVWYRLVSGGEGPHYVVATGRNGFAEFEPPEKSIETALTEAYGARKATSLLNAIRENTVRIYTEILQYRPDIGYIPAAK
jgi:hypothetical protein